MRSKLNQQLKLSNRYNCIVSLERLMLEVRYDNNRCNICKQPISSVPYLTKQIQRALYHITCAYNGNILTDRQFIIINKLPVIELKIEKLEIKDENSLESNI